MQSSAISGGLLLCVGSNDPVLVIHLENRQQTIGG